MEGRNWETLKKMIWYVKVIIAIVTALLFGFSYMFVRHKWRYADSFFIYFTIVVALVFWWIFNFWIGVTFYIVYSWMFSKVDIGHGEYVVCGNDDYLLHCSKCKYEHLVVEHIERNIVKTHCTRCGNDDIFHLDKTATKIG